MMVKWRKSLKDQDKDESLFLSSILVEELTQREQTWNLDLKIYQTWLNQISAINRFAGLSLYNDKNALLLELLIWQALQKMQNFTANNVTMN